MQTPLCTDEMHIRKLLEIQQNTVNDDTFLVFCSKQCNIVAYSVLRAREDLGKLFLLSCDDKEAYGKPEKQSCTESFDEKPCIPRRLQFWHCKGPMHLK